MAFEISRGEDWRFILTDAGQFILYCFPYWTEDYPECVIDGRIREASPSVLSWSVYQGRTLETLFGRTLLHRTDAEIAFVRSLLLDAYSRGLCPRAYALQQQFVDKIRASKALAKAKLAGCDLDAALAEIRSLTAPEAGQ